MEKKLLKTGIYSFVISILIGLAFKQNFVVTTYDHVVQKNFTPIEIYIIEILKFSATTTLICILLAALIIYWRHSTNKREIKIYSKAFIKGLLIGLIILLLIYLAIRIWLLN